MRTAWKVFWVAATGLGLLAALLFAGVFAINLRDEPLGAEAQALRRPPANTVVDADNIFLALVGADAPSGSSVIAAGRERIESSNRRLHAQAASPAGAAPGTGVAEAGQGTLAFQGTQVVCESVDADCWKEVPAHRAELASLERDNAGLLERYRALQGMAGYFDITDYDVMAGFPPLAYGRAERKLYIAGVALRMHADTLPVRRQAVADLRADMEVWHRVLVGQGTLISSMVALANLHSDEWLLAQAIADPAVGVDPGAGDQDSPTPLYALEDFKLGRTMAAEYRAQAPMWEHLGNPRALAARAPTGIGWIDGWLGHLGKRSGNPFLRPNATANLHAAFFNRLIEVASAPPDRFPQARARLQQWEQDHLEWRSVRTAYNPVGKILLSIATPAYGPYVLRAWDEAAFQRAVRLSFEIRRLRIPAADIPRFMQAHPEWSTHPVDHRSFIWNEQANTIAVQVLAKHPANRSFVIPVWRPGH